MFVDELTRRATMGCAQECVELWCAAVCECGQCFVHGEFGANGVAKSMDAEPRVLVVSRKRVCSVFGGERDAQCVAQVWVVCCSDVSVMGLMPFGAGWGNACGR